MKHINQIIGGIIIVVAVIREGIRHPLAETLADLDNVN